MTVVKELELALVIDLAKSGTLYLKYTLKVSSTDDEKEELERKLMNMYLLMKKTLLPMKGEHF